MIRKGIGLAAAVGGIGLWLATGGTAQAIPANQAKCSFTQQTISASATFVPISDLTVTVDNGVVPRRVIVQLSADIGVAPAAEVRVAYAVDGGSPSLFGPTNFANHQEFFETRATIAVIPLPAGTHTITPLWRVSGAAGTQATIVNGCVTAERTTK
jgi:hypothetical protein